MTLFDFTEHYRNDKACRDHFKLERDKGIKCNFNSSRVLNPLRVFLRLEWV